MAALLIKMQFYNFIIIKYNYYMKYLNLENLPWQLIEIK